MRINCYHIRSLIDELLTKYTGLKEDSTDHDNCISISGSISINRTHNNYLVDKEYDLKILVPFNDYNLPRVWDIGNHIDKAYVHRYPDGELCLETNAYVALGFYKKNSLLYWMENTVESYYYSYEYYIRFGEFPFGERGHNLIGVLEAYQEIFNEQDIVKVLKLLQAISQRKYKGHLLCPCNSGIITRKCHGNYIYPFIYDDQLHHIAKKDYMNICEEIKKNDK